jgi:ESCRT-II complex subunit VPS36
MMSDEDWSPFYCLPKAKLTPSGLIELDNQDNEVLLLRRSNIEFRHEGPTPMAPRPKNLPSSSIWKNRTSYQNLIITITTHRMCLLYKNENTNITDARFVHLSNTKLSTLVSKGGPSLLSPNSTYKIVFNTQTYDKLTLVFRSGSQSGPRDDRDAAIIELKKALERKQWTVTARLQEKKLLQNESFNNSENNNYKVGLDRLMAKSQMRHRNNAQLADVAFSGDSEQLLQEAVELLKVIQKYTVLIQKYEGKDNDDNDDEVAATKLKGLLSDMGMTSALTPSQMSGGGGGGKNTPWKSKSNNTTTDQTQRDYHELTARQVADFLVPRLRKQITHSGGSGMMSLTDVYCLFNRARGTNLISPEDLREACNTLDSLNIGLNQRTFPSGITVLQLNDLALSANSSKEIKSKIISICPITALEASHILKLSPLLANEQLEEAERLGWLCRDINTSNNNIKFYPNKFITDW